MYTYVYNLNVNIFFRNLNVCKLLLTKSTFKNANNTFRFSLFKFTYFLKRFKIDGGIIFLLHMFFVFSTIQII